MPNVVTPLSDVTQSVSRPIIYDIIQQVQDITKITKEAKVFFPGDLQRMQQPGSSIDPGTRDIITGTNKIVFIEVEDDFDVNTLATTAVTYSEHIPVFLDRDLGIEIVPVYSTNNVTINFKYRDHSKGAVVRWRNDIRTKISQMRDINLHDIRYHYLLPEAFLELLCQVHRQREAVAGYGQTVEEYIASMSTERLTLIGDLVNKNQHLAISETQTRIVGIYDFDALPEKPEHDDSTGTWTISFSYKFSYERPTSCRIKYPVIIHNQLLPQKYVNFVTEVPDPSKKNLSFTKSLGAMHRFEQLSVTKSMMNIHSAIRLPAHDEFIPSNEQPGTGTIFYALCTIDPSQSNVLLNLNELGDLVLDPDILKFIRESETPYITKFYQSIIQVGMYRKHAMCSDGSLRCLSDLTIESTGELDLRNEHRLRLSLVTDITLLSKDALARLRRYPKALKKIVESINTVLRDNQRLVVLAQRNYITERDFEPIFSSLVGRRSMDDIRKNNYGWNTVETAQILSYKQTA